MRITSILSNKRLCKVQQQDGEFLDFPLIYKANIENHEFLDIDEFASLYERVAVRGGALMHGEPLVDGHQRRLSKDDPKNGDKRTLIDSGSNVLCLDIDKVPSCFKVGSDEYRNDIFKRLERVIPELNQTDCIFALTSSAGVKTKKNQDFETNINVHIFYMVEALNAFEMRNVIHRLNEKFKEAGSSIEFDGSVSKLAQPLYIAPPVLLEDLNLKREFLIRGSQRVLDVRKLGLVQEKKVQGDVYVDNEEYLDNVKDIDIEEDDQKIALMQVRNNGHAGGSYGGMTGFIKYLKQKLYSRDRIEALWNSTYDGSNWTLEESKIFEDQWQSVDYTVPVYLDGVQRKDTFAIGLWEYNGCMVVPNWINGIIKLSEFGNKPLVIYMNSNSRVQEQENIFRHASHYFTNVRIELFEYSSKTSKEKLERIKIKKSKKIEELIGVAPGGELDDFVL